MKITNYVGKNDVLWQNLSTKYNIDTTKQLKIYTFGSRFAGRLSETDRAKLFDKFDEVIKMFDASVLYSKDTTFDKLLYKLKGTDLAIQQSMKTTEIFDSFIEDIVKEIEDNNLDKIAIYCNAGHHRSVACAEMLKNLYLNVEVEHLTYYFI